MIKKCIGCGATLQFKEKEKEGYIIERKYNDSLYCERCFKLKNYGEVKPRNNKDKFDIILKEKKHITYLVDILNIDKNIVDILNKIDKSKLIILITKFDILPKGIKEGKIIKYFKENFLNIENVICISAKTKYNIDKYYNFLISNNIKSTYVIGNTNAGKSSFINALLESKNIKSYIVTSPLANLTEDIIDVNIGDIHIYDTPGFINSSSIYNYLKPKDFKKYLPRKQLKVKTFQVKKGYSIIVDKILRIDNIDKDNSFNFYINNNLNYKKVKTVNNNELTKLPFRNVKINGNEDIVINGLGFIKINKEGNLKIYSLDEEVITKKVRMI